MTKFKPPSGSKRSSGRPGQKGRPSQVRIIGGKWRGRKLPFTPITGLRPTLGRTRETLFNWLRGSLQDCVCIDLFAGSGALGFEALSQGARQVIFVEQHRKVAAQIQSNLESLNSTDGQVRAMNALDFLQTHQDAYQVVFLDPPFDKPSLLEQSLSHLNTKSDLKYVYLETDNPSNLNPLLEATVFSISKQTRAGDAHGLLLCPA